jgi:hypothetical protein
MTTFNVKKVKTDKAGNQHYQAIGTVLFRSDGKTGVLWLNWLDGEFALFKQTAKEDPSAGKEVEAA